LDRFEGNAQTTLSYLAVNTFGESCNHTPIITTPAEHIFLCKKTVRITGGVCLVSAKLSQILKSVVCITDMSGLLLEQQADFSLEKMKYGPD